MSRQEKDQERERARKKKRRAAILDAALKVFARRGIRAGTGEEIACAAGCAKGTLYLYFPGGKAQLAEAATAEAWTRLRAALPPADGEAAGLTSGNGTNENGAGRSDLTSALERCFARVLRVCTEQAVPVRLVLLEGERLVPPVAPMGTLHEAFLDLLAASFFPVYRRADQAGALAEVSPAQAAAGTAITAAVLIRGLHSWFRPLCTEVSGREMSQQADRAAHVVTHLLLDGLAARSTPAWPAVSAGTSLRASDALPS